MPRYYKRAVLVLSDFVLLFAVAWSAMSLRYQALYWPQTTPELILFAAAPVITVATFAWFGLYRLVTRFIGYRGTLRIFACVGLSVLIWALMVFMFGQHGIPRTVIVTYGFIGAILVTASRQLAGLLLKSVGIQIPKLPLDIERKPVLIFGAGQLGSELLESLRRVSDCEPVGFIDNEPSMWGQYVGGVKVYRPQKIGHVIERAEVREVLLAVPETHRRERRQILAELESYPVQVKVMPSMEEIATGKVGITDVRPLEVEDLLGRDPVPPNMELLTRSILGKSILVSGAGGSVGSELVRQILKQHPTRLVLLDISEVALYEIEMEISELIERNFPEGGGPELVGVLGSVLDDLVVRDTIKRYAIETIYHAAAYKHVPIVENNAAVGLLNNTFGCAVIAEAARDLGVERFVLISTDKAVRPTNIMGASKRLAELVLQAHADEENASTVFTMVRFGNVLDSSGSVVRRFRNQIKQGGPVTVTHPEIIRYFMSIPEAAELVIQAGTMATGGDVFVLDMGDPIKIDDLARLMIRLAGSELRTEDTPNGDIEIVYTGLRPGEKLYEELLLGANTTGTEHPRILRSGEPFLPADDLWRELETLSDAMKRRDIDAIHNVLKTTVEGYCCGGAVENEDEEAQMETVEANKEASKEATVFAPASRTLH
ncbi:MAG: polysaccharide biosynthesis protein [Alphaproteobacteria bacterium]|nr:polysaccharide biosynthesis protein [Alphaproteobacteria bacterium]